MMQWSLSVKLDENPCLIINRNAFRHKKLVYIARANKKIRYQKGSSRIAYIGSTKNGANRIANTAAYEGAELLSKRGIRNLEFHIVTCGGLPHVKTWEKLERALLIRFRARFGKAPLANIHGRKFLSGNEKNCFSEAKLNKVIDVLS